MEAIKWIAYIVLIISTGVILGRVCKRDIQKSKCPYCHCKDFCKIGDSIETSGSVDELRPFACKKDNNLKD